MQAVHQQCCGLDIHKKTVVACALLTQPDGKVSKQVRTVLLQGSGHVLRTSDGGSADLELVGRRLDRPRQGGPCHRQTQMARQRSGQR